MYLRARGKQRKEREMEDREGSSRVEDLYGSSVEGERWKTAEDLPGDKTYVDLLVRERDGRPRRIFQGRRPREIFWRKVRWKTAGDLPGEKT